MYSTTYILFLVWHILSIFTTASYAKPISFSPQHLVESPTSPEEDLLKQPWIGELYGSDSNLNAEDKNAFKKTLQGVVLGAPLDANGGGFNAGLYELHEDYNGHKAGEVVVKCMPEPIDEKTWGEVKALKTVDYFIDSGLLFKPKAHGQHEDKPTPVILMKKIPGVIPAKTSLWKKGRVQKVKLANALKPKIKVEVVNWAVDKKILVSDFHLKNIHVVLTEKDATVESVSVLDFGFPGVYTVKPTVNKPEVEEWFEKRWKERVIV
ncbi:hypothetical protein BDP27DRAFT_1347337 [Rhodocollybia butyracea]|uniref:Protein kinase domain-containing protein n=1 Tax=Rhodocollybia butyracea TaxID=206335 RepID=A0A9P5P7N6_9AGAR|nr:hypothetical protein BDP27DRAFT_1347337 [Rhodocollybia butyracea]